MSEFLDELKVLDSSNWPKTPKLNYAIMARRNFVVFAKEWVCGMDNVTLVGLCDDFNDYMLRTLEALAA